MSVARLMTSHNGPISVPFMFHSAPIEREAAANAYGTKMIDQSTLRFLSEASSNHGAEWLADNRAQTDCARRNLIEFTSQLIASAGLIDPRIGDANSDPRKCLAKAPISRGIGSIAVRVSLSKNAAATYFMQISPGRSYSGGGALSPPPRLARILRQTIASHTGKWRGIVEGPIFRKYFPSGLTDGHDVSAKGFVKNHDALCSFNLKNFGACRSVPDEELMLASLVEETVKSFAAARALVDYINRATTRLPEAR
ncbi:DUF2461 family protein [Neorhizobium sp. NPDC001467]|uniref:DUF2461 family protein n=1 Tax=Neorhizobium sp. NPDC001467 TaxID=3390595 RepID=UPI003D08A0E5